MAVSLNDVSRHIFQNHSGLAFKITYDNLEKMGGTQNRLALV